MSKNLIKNLIVVVLFLFVAILSYFFIIKPTTKERKERERRNTANYNLKLLGKEIRGYSEKHNGYLPSADNWCDLLMEHNKYLTKENFRHPGIEGSVLAFNEALSGMRFADIPKDVVLLFEAKGEWNLKGGKELIKKANPNRDIVYVLLINGEIKPYWIEEESMKNWVGKFTPLRWKP